MTTTAAQLDALTTVHEKISVSIRTINVITANHKLRMKKYRVMGEKQMNQVVSFKSEVKSEQNNTLKVVSSGVREIQAETVAMKLEKNDKLLDMSVKQRTLKISHASAVVDKNVTIYTVKRASRETVHWEAKLTKDIRVAMKNTNSNKLKI